jgi:uncharacterized protein involved in type VI secretion and phage assembly
MAALPGVYSASVLNNRDPEGLGRVQVRVPGATDPSGDLWARVATMMAGPNRGTWFVPDVGDEVLVAFEHGDPRTPYVVGSLWSAKAPPPQTAAGQDPGVKLIRSASGATLRFNADRQDSLILETPGGQRITLQDGPGSVRIEDSNGNVVTLTTSGVTVTSSTTVTVDASAVAVSAGMVSVNAGIAQFSGVVRCDTLIANSVISASYSPGVGNVM